MKSAFRIVLWILTIGLGLFGLVTMSGLLETSGMDAAGRGISQAIGLLFCLIAVGGVITLLLARRWRGWLWVAGGILALPLLFIIVATVGNAFMGARQQREMEDVHAGRADFRDQPALLAVAQAISKNDEAAIRSAARNVPDLNAAGRDGKTLLYFAVEEALERPELVKAVETLLSLGADPNYNNGQLASFAMWRAMSSEIRVLRALLDAGGNPNGPDFRGQPIIFANWEQTYHESDRTQRFRLLLDRGADPNSTLSAKASSFPGYSLLLYRVNFGRGDASAYSDALALLEGGADFRHASDEGMTLVKMMHEHRQHFAQTNQQAPPEFEKLWQWLEAQGAFQE